MTRVAALDCGTNSLRLLIAERDDVSGVVRDVERRMEIVRLGQGVDRRGRFDPEALARTLAVSAEYAERCRAENVSAIRFVATSATRDAADRDDFFDGVRQRLDVEPEVISGAEEARLSFIGACQGLPALGATDAPLLVVDIGGGSTEFVLGTLAGGISASISTEVGCVRLTERYGPDAPGVAGFAGDVQAAIDRAAAQVPWSSAAAVVGLAGSVTTVTAHALRLDRYDPERIHAARLPIAGLRAAAAELVAMDVEQRSALPFMHPGRVDVIGSGAAIWSRILARVGADAGLDVAWTSERDILDGIVHGLLADREGSA